MFARFGARVTVVEAAGRLLWAEEPEAGPLLEAVFAREGIAVRTGTRAHGRPPSRSVTSWARTGPRRITGQAEDWAAWHCDLFR